MKVSPNQDSIIDIDLMSHSTSWTEGAVVNQGFPNWGMLVFSFGEEGFRIKVSPNQDIIVDIDPPPP